MSVCVCMHVFVCVRENEGNTWREIGRKYDEKKEYKEGVATIAPVSIALVHCRPIDVLSCCKRARVENTIGRVRYPPDNL